ncbi:SRPBCC domain-containing protein [Saccharomonospora sp. NPDC006951]
MSDRDAVWQALSNGERRRIIDLLRAQPLTTGAIVGSTGLDRFVVQRHLGVLRKAGLVVVTARGRERHNALNASALYQATIGWLRPVDRAYASALDGLRAALETPVESSVGSSAEEDFVDIRHLQVRQRIEIAATAERCFSALTGDLSSWWGSPYLQLDRAETRISAAARLGGLVSERAEGHEIAWGTVSELAPDRIVAWSGRIALGNAASGTVRFTLTEHDGVTAGAAGGTVIALEHESIGAFDPESERAFASGWNDLLHRLKAFVEAGTAYGVAGANQPPPGLEGGARGSEARPT